RLAGTMDPGSGSGAATGHLGGSAAGLAGGAALGGALAGVFAVVALVACGRDRARAESAVGRCADAVEAQKSQASDAKTTLAAVAGQERWTNRLGLILDMARRGARRGDARWQVGGYWNVGERRVSSAARLPAPSVRRLSSQLAVNPRLRDRCPGFRTTTPSTDRCPPPRPRFRSSSCSGSWRRGRSPRTSPPSPG